MGYGGAFFLRERRDGRAMARAFGTAVVKKGKGGVDSGSGKRTGEKKNCDKNCNIMMSVPFVSFHTEGPAEWEKGISRLFCGRDNLLARRPGRDALPVFFGVFRAVLRASEDRGASSSVRSEAVRGIPGPQGNILPAQFEDCRLWRPGGAGTEKGPVRGRTDRALHGFESDGFGSYTCMRSGKRKPMAPVGQLVRQLAQCQHSSP